MARVRLEGVRKVYENGFVALHDATFEVDDGEFMVLVGPSGCGKSTTLRMVAGLESITAGQLSIGDRVVNDVPASRRDIAMVFQNYALYPHMSVRENMAFALKLRNEPRAEIERRVGAAADILGIESMLDRKPRQLSGGQRQRVAVGRALVREPQVFLFDEPLSNLDAKLRVQMRKEISRLHRRLDATMIYVTHDQVEAMTMGDRIVVMSEGRIQQIGAPMELYERPANRFVAGFIGSPAMNFFNATMHRDDAGAGLELRAFAGRLSIPLEGAAAVALDRATAGPSDHAASDEIVVGIRPENIYVAGGLHLPPRVAEVDLTLDAVEPMGSEIVLYAGDEGEDIVARVAPQPLPGPEQRIRLAFDIDRLHLFEATGASLHPH
jgi:multiple sugar transport system ATP-binding protein